MKKRLLLLLSAALILSLLLVLCACGGGKEKTDEKETDAGTKAATEAATEAATLPTGATAYQKVQFAFNGVEKSLKRVGEKTSADLDSRAVQRLLTGQTPDPLSVIGSIYTSGDSQGDVIDELEYDQPPMIQFQCLKAVFDNVGEGFQFGVKHYNSMTGEVFVDPETGRDMNGISLDDTRNQYKYDYTFRLDLKIDVGENDLITADVSFGIRLARESEEINTNWYVRLILDYDMTSETPIYKLTMWTANDERELACIAGYVYEYDFVDMKANGINEWRKFVLQSDTELKRDGAHPDFASYRNAGVEFRADTCKWYKDNNLKKITRHTEEKDATLAEAFFAFGLNATDIDKNALLSISADVKTDAIKTVYDEFGRVFGKDVIYSLVTKKEDDHHGGGQRDAVGITILTEEGEAWGAQNIERDCTLSELLSGYGPWGQGIGIKRPCVYTIDADGNRIDRIENFTDYDFTITVGKPGQGGFESKIGLGDLLSTVIADNLGGMEAIEQNGFLVNVRLTDKTDSSRSATFSAIIGFRSEIEEQEAKQFPAELTEIGVPEYKTDNGSFKTVEGKQDGYALEVRSNNDERTAYLKKLSDDGFVPNENGEYAKTVGENVLFITVSDFAGDVLTISVRVEKNSGQNDSSWQTETIAGLLDGKYTLPQPKGAGTVTFKLNTDDKNLYVYGLTDDEKAAYLDEVASQDGVWVVGETNLTTRKIKFLYESCFYAIDLNLDVGGALFFELNLERNGAQPAVGIVVNGNGPIYLDPAEDDRGYVKTVKLNEGDVVSFINAAGRPIDAPAFERSADDPEGTVITYQAGVYTIVCDAMIEIRK